MWTPSRNGSRSSTRTIWITSWISKSRGVIRHIGISSHNPKVAMKAAESGYVEMILFSINPAFDMLPASEDIDTLFAEKFDAELKGIDPDRAQLYRICEQRRRRHHGHEGLRRRAGCSTRSAPRSA